MQSRKTFCGCPRDYKPVCSSKGKLAQTYDNLCLLTCSQRNSFDLLYSYEGPCCQRLQCKHGEMPLCDTKGNMYRDRCTFQYSQCVEWKTRNNALRVGTACPCTYKCPNLFRPVCDTAGNTYKNKCYFLREQCYSKMAYGRVIHFYHDESRRGNSKPRQCRMVRLKRNSQMNDAASKDNFRSIADFKVY
uniref:Kazal-like domain-containing protein n=1 Tax=Trichuris muris TaxID=70415 RepID=A0A5S6Q5A6_TRIMR